MAIEGRVSNGIDRSPPGHMLQRRRVEDAHAGGDIQGIPAEVGADYLPGMSSVPCLKEKISRKIEGVGIDGRKQQGSRPEEAVFTTADSFRRDILYLSCPFIVAGDLPSVNDIGIQWICGDIPVFFHADGMPFPEGDLPVIAPGGDADGAALLLTAIYIIGEGVVGADMIELGGGLIVPGGKDLSPVAGDEGALVAGDQ